jgi:hypothetical protein
MVRANRYNTTDSGIINVIPQASDSSTRAAAEVAPELYREIVTMDDSFAIYRPPIKAEEKPGENHYVKCRKLLLTNKVKAKELVVRVIILIIYPF